jgi:hypothetical protein
MIMNKTCLVVLFFGLFSFLPIYGQNALDANSQPDPMRPMYLQQEMQLKNELSQLNLDIMQQENMLQNQERELANAESDENLHPGGMAAMRVQSQTRAVKLTQNLLSNLEQRKSRKEVQLAEVESKLN